MLWIITNYFHTSKTLVLYCKCYKKIYITRKNYSSNKNKRISSFRSKRRRRLDGQPRSVDSCCIIIMPPSPSLATSQLLQGKTFSHISVTFSFLPLRLRVTQATQRDLDVTASGDVGLRSPSRKRSFHLNKASRTRVGLDMRAVSRYLRERSRYRDTRNDGWASSRACFANYNVIAAINEQFRGASVRRSVASDINSKRIT